MCCTCCCCFAPDSTRFAFTDSQGQVRWYGDRSLSDLFAQHQPLPPGHYPGVRRRAAGGRPFPRMARRGCWRWGSRRWWRCNIPSPTRWAGNLLRPCTGSWWAARRWEQPCKPAGVTWPSTIRRCRMTMESRNFGAIMLWQRPIPFIQERKPMTQTIILVAPDGRRYASDLQPDTFVGEIIRAFVAELPTPGLFCPPYPPCRPC